MSCITNNTTDTPPCDSKMEDMLYKIERLENDIDTYRHHYITVSKGYKKLEEENEKLKMENATLTKRIAEDYNTISHLQLNKHLYEQVNPTVFEKMKSENEMLKNLIRNIHQLLSVENGTVNN